MYNIIPATNKKVIDNIVSFMYGFKNRKAVRAPRGSAIPDIRQYLNALSLLPVE